MRRGAKRTRTPLTGHQNCAICHPAPKSDAARDRRRDKRAISEGLREYFPGRGRIMKHELTHQRSSEPVTGTNAKREAYHVRAAAPSPIMNGARWVLLATSSLEPTLANARLPRA